MPNVRHIARGITKSFFVPTIASISAPTAAEINAGTALTPQLVDIQGASFANSPQAVPDYVDNFDSKIPGIDQAADPVLHFYNLKPTGNTLRTTLAKGVTGNLVIFYAGTAGASPAAADICDVWPVQSTGPAKDLSATDAVKWHTTLPASARPALDAAVV